MELIQKAQQPAKSSNVLFTVAGLRGSVRFPKSMFEGEAPASIPFTANLKAPKAPKEPKVKLTAEERKAARAAQPKPTLADRIARQEARLAKLRAAATENQPSM